MRLRYLPFLVILFLCFSCKEKGITYKMPVFPNEDKAQFTLLTPELYYGVIQDIWTAGPYIITFASDQKTHSFCHVYDKESGVLLGEAFMRGRGPGEIQAAYGSFDVRDGSVHYFDFTKNAFLEFNIDSLLTQGMSAISESGGDFVPGERFRGSTGRHTVSLYIESGRESDGPGISRLTVKDMKGNLVAENDNYPEENKLASFANTYYVAFSPDGTKCAIAPTWSAVLELYDLPNLRTRYIGYFSGQEYEYSTGNIQFTENTAINYSDLYATDKHVFLSYGGDVPFQANQALPLEERKLVCNKLDVFNWNGRPIRRIVTDYRISKFCVDMEEDYVYAIVEDQLRRIYIARLSL